MKLSALLQRVGFLASFFPTHSSGVSPQHPVVDHCFGHDCSDLVANPRGINFRRESPTIMGALSNHFSWPWELHVCYIRARGLLILRH